MAVSGPFSPFKACYIVSRQMPFLPPGELWCPTLCSVTGYIGTGNSLNALNAARVRVLHILPATPLCASFEIGRMLLPTTFQSVYAWDWQAPSWKQALRLKQVLEDDSNPGRLIV